MQSVWATLWLVMASLVAGTLNAIAGGGSFLSFPALLGVGAPPIQANATNTVALWPGQFASIVAFRDEYRPHTRLLRLLCVAAGLGGLSGAIMLLRTGQTTFMRLVPWLLLIAALLFAASVPVSRWLQARGPAGHRSRGLLFAGMVAACFYIGYFGAGAGFLVMSLLALYGIENVNQINALKAATTSIANGIAVLTFIVAKQVLWQDCLWMILASSIGGYLGGRFSRRVDPRAMRAVVVAIGLSMAAYFFWNGNRA
jgi:hypothetical protein